MWYMELRVKTKYVLGLPGGTQLVLEHEKNNLRTMTPNPLLFFGQTGEDYLWRVCYQRGLPGMLGHI